MLKFLRCGVLSLALCISLTSCASLSTAGPARIDTAILAIDSAMHSTLLGARIACEKAADPAGCFTSAEKAHSKAMAAMKVIKQWVPELKEALAASDEIKARTAQEHIAAAIEALPEAYGGVRSMVSRLAK